MSKYIVMILGAVAVAGVFFIQHSIIKDKAVEIKSLRDKLQECKSAKEAKSFEAIWNKRAIRSGSEKRDINFSIGSHSVGF